MNKKRCSWVLLGVMVLVGAFLIVFLGSQNQLPLVPDLNAQILNYMSSYEYGSISSQGLGIPGGMTYGYCGAYDGGTYLTCGFGGCGLQQQYYSPFGPYSQLPSTFSTCIGSPGCSPTGSFCSYPTIIVCPGGVTGYLCPGNTGNMQWTNIPGMEQANWGIYPFIQETILQEPKMPWNQMIRGAQTSFIPCPEPEIPIKLNLVTQTSKCMEPITYLTCEIRCGQESTSGVTCIELLQEIRSNPPPAF